MNELELCRMDIDEIDRQMAVLFEKRMQVSERVADYKIAHELPVLDPVREKAVTEKRKAQIKTPAYLPHYEQFIKDVMKVSRRRQKELMAESQISPLCLPVFSEEGEYDIVLGRGLLPNVGDCLPLRRKVLVVTDSGVPSIYAETVAEQCETPVIATLPAGEASKNLTAYEHLLSLLLQNGFTRSDCVVAVGGGVVGDISGFVAASYMRGIDFYNIPTTLLSQLDSSIGGKTAVDFHGVKNIVGAFYQPKKVLIDPDVLHTLDKRQFSAGLCEAIKMAVTCDASLFEMIEQSRDIEKDIDRIIEGALRIKRDVVEQDPKEQGLRRVLNFGHTVGHAIESAMKGELLHGECVGIGMLPMCEDSVGKRILALLEKHGLPTHADVEKNTLLKLMKHDKKASGHITTVVYVWEIGTFRFERVTETELEKYLERLP